MELEPTPFRLWKSLAREDRLVAARAFWSNPPPEAAAAAAHELTKVMRVRPQAFGRVPPERRAQALAGLARIPDGVAESLLVALHLEERRPLLGAFLDALGIAHEDGAIGDGEEVPAPTVERVREALPGLLAAFPAEQIRVYWNALWLQDDERWAALATVAGELAPEAG